MTSLNWQKSSYSQHGANCLNVAISPERTPQIYLRESDCPEAIVTTTPARLADLLQKVKAGDLDRP
ncbi:hypothetical protein GCM10009753_33730 [Streptantibioticus ferralitis]|uniref:DUF397 domain-containing protein n=2 Tax=Streptantibioticus ferralitis TaxID=236510 RepID=A0ABT5Z6P8_9ACTN|nr:DUF397 domain-containing protein [Streptantibioticus ferralitis]